MSSGVTNGKSMADGSTAYAGDGNQAAAATNRQAAGRSALSDLANNGEMVSNVQRQGVGA